MNAQAEWLHPELPLFGLSASGEFYIYVPGRLRRISALQYDELRNLWRTPLSLPREASLSAMAAKLEAEARIARDVWQARAAAPFRPECLLLYLNNRCNCRCVYCYAAAGRAHGSSVPTAPVLDLKAIEAAARLVIEHCRDAGRRFTLVVHGGGEPTQNFRLLQGAVLRTRLLAAEAGCAWSGHLATNGVMTRAQADWVAANFTSIGLSCDGPRDLHDRQRPLSDGRPSWNTVCRTLRILQKGRAHVGVRTTVMPESVERLNEIVTCLAADLGVVEIRMEPVYRAAVGACFDRERADQFAANFLRARARARQLGAQLSFSGARTGEIHGPYCNVLRGVLHLVPGNRVSACFFCTGNDDERDTRMSAGRWNPETGRISLDGAFIRRHCDAALRMPDACRGCIASLHCTRGCPDNCLAVGDTTGAGSFRCMLNRAITMNLLIETVALSDPESVRAAVPGDARSGDAVQLRDQAADEP